MRARSSGFDFVDPMILRTLRESKSPLSILGINYLVNSLVGRTINLNIIKNHLVFLVKNGKISESLDQENGVTYYRIIA